MVGWPGPAEPFADVHPAPTIVVSVPPIVTLVPPIAVAEVTVTVAVPPELATPPAVPPLRLMAAAKFVALVRLPLLAFETTLKFRPVLSDPSAVSVITFEGLYRAFVT